MNTFVRIVVLAVILLYSRTAVVDEANHTRPMDLSSGLRKRLFASSSRFNLQALHTSPQSSSLSAALNSCLLVETSIADKGLSDEWKTVCSRVASATETEMGGVTEAVPELMALLEETIALQAELKGKACDTSRSAVGILQSKLPLVH